MTTALQASPAPSEPPALDVERQEALGLLLAVDNALLDFETGEETIGDIFDALDKAADEARAVLTPIATPTPEAE